MPGVGNQVAPFLFCCSRLKDGVLVGYKIQALFQASKVAGSRSSWPFFATELVGIARFSSYDFLITCLRNVLVRLFFSVLAQLRTLLQLVSWSVQGMHTIRRRSHISAASKRASSFVLIVHVSLQYVMYTLCSLRTKWVNQLNRRLYSLPVTSIGVYFRKPTLPSSWLGP